MSDAQENGGVSRFAAIAWELAERAASVPNISLIPSLLLTVGSILDLYPYLSVSVT